MTANGQSTLFDGVLGRLHDLAGETLEMADPSDLARHVSTALYALPAYFSAEDMHFPVMDADSLPNLGSLLSHPIETQVVATLNRMRAVWDPGEDWGGFVFERQPQVFPDVRLVRPLLSGPQVALGIELKGWYLLAGESQPTFRYKVTPAACAAHDLIAVVPWHLDGVLSGKPVIGRPWVHNARQAAEARNDWWQHGRTTTYSTDIVSPSSAAPYPASKDLKINDEPAAQADNFGRIARVPGLMDDFIASAMKEKIGGIPAGDWIRFIGRCRG